MPRRLVIATTNPHKVREIRQLLSDAPVELLGLADLPRVAEPSETSETFADNARLKALSYSEQLGPALEELHALLVAEDSGLIVDALGGEPGVRSARFLREDATYTERFAEIYRRLRDRRDRPWTARFVCALAVVQRGRVVFETSGIVEGEVSETARGTGGFGYDPIFFYPPYGRTLAEVSDAEKLRVAHRGHAFRKLGEWLRSGEVPHFDPEF
jgi:XTP/dITP diphosphohydrolase